MNRKINLIRQKVLNFVKNREIILLGFGKSNMVAAEFLDRFGIDFTVCDINENKPIINLNLKNSKVKFKLGKNYLDDLSSGIIFRSPGISYFCRELIEARKCGAVVTSEIEFFFQICPCKICGITGSDGKTTVTGMIHEILNYAGLETFVGGNIGVPILGEIEKINENSIVITELSSFQLISMKQSPQVAVITNISPNHLDIHKDFEEYVKSKFNILKYQNKNDLAVLNFEDKILKEFSNSLNSDLKFFSTETKTNGAWVDENDMIKINLNNEIISLFNKKEIKLPGKHNLENFLAAICACSYFLKNDFEKFIKAIRFAAENFGGTEHRLEFVREISGVKFYNDSIATSPTRVIKGALSVFSDKNVVLIAGGYDKNLPFDELGDVICQKVKVLVLFGSSSSKINAAVKSSKILNKPSVYECSAMEEAVRSAYNKAAEGDVVLFSPACAAFDLYQNFEERGRHFKRAVQDIK